MELFTLRNAHGIEVKATSYGAIITSIVTPDRSGAIRGDIVLGFDTLEGYLKDPPYFGASSAATATASRRAASRSTARPTRSR